MKYFKTFVDKNSNIYSLDMVRLNFTIKSSLYPEFKQLVNYMDLHSNCFQQYFRNFKSIGYRHLWRCTIQYDEDIASFVYGTKLNNKKKMKIVVLLSLILINLQIFKCLILFINVCIIFVLQLS